MPTSFVNSPEPKTTTKACFGWIPLNRWIFHHSSSFLMTLGPYWSAFVSFLSYRWLFNVATSFVNGPIWNIEFLPNQLFLGYPYNSNTALLEHKVFIACLVLSATHISCMDPRCVSVNIFWYGFG